MYTNEMISGGKTVQAILRLGCNVGITKRRDL
jgi:hypothetical protein